MLGVEPAPPTAYGRASSGAEYAAAGHDLPIRPTAAPFLCSNEAYLDRRRLRSVNNPMTDQVRGYLWGLSVFF
jgi:hypothetical protein